MSVSNRLFKLLRLLTGYVIPDDYWPIREKALRAKGPVRRRLYTHYLNYVAHKYNAYLPLSVSFASRPCMPHFLSGVFINKSVRIGRDCVIYQQVTIGESSLTDSKRGTGAPVIGDGCLIGCGAKIIGPVTIGNNVRIGANCVVTEDVPDGCTVVLEKPRILRLQHKEGALSHYRKSP